MVGSIAVRREKSTKNPFSRSNKDFPIDMVMNLSVDFSIFEVCGENPLFGSSSSRGFVNYSGARRGGLVVFIMSDDE